MSFQSTGEMKQLALERGIPLWQAVMEADAEEQDITPEASMEKMRFIWEAMKDAIRGYDPNMLSRSGLVGAEGGKMEQYAALGDTFCGPFVSKIVARALMMGCSNACMRRIVAAPTAGACGVLPALLYTCWEERDCSDEEIVHALYACAGFGQVIANRASISGAQGGCQAEIGSAAAMGAVALVALKNGTPEQMEDACAMALKNLMGLVCDPVAGLVEVPCVKRNVIGAMDALSAGDMALAGIHSTIPADEVIDTMGRVGNAMSPRLKETAKGGLAISPTAKAFTARWKAGEE